MGNQRVLRQDACNHRAPWCVPGVLLPSVCGTLGTLPVLLEAGYPIPGRLDRAGCLFLDMHLLVVVCAFVERSLVFHPLLT